MTTITTEKCEQSISYKVSEKMFGDHGLSLIEEMFQKLGVNVEFEQLDNFESKDGEVVKLTLKHYKTGE